MIDPLAGFVAGAEKRLILCAAQIGKFATRGAYKYLKILETR